VGIAVEHPRYRLGADVRDLGDIPHGGHLLNPPSSRYRRGTDKL
jgi:hypothetical protein